MPQGQLPQGWSIAPIAPPTAPPVASAPPATPAQSGSPTIEGQLVSGAKNFVQKANPWNIVQGVADLTYHPIASAQSYHETQNRMFNAAKDSFIKGDIDEAFMHFKNYMLNAIPGLGSGLEGAENQVRSGDIGGGIGSGAGLGVINSMAARPSIVSDVASGTATAARAAGQAAKTHGVPLAIGAGTQYALTQAGFPSWAAAEISIPAMAAAHPTLRGFMGDLIGAIRGRTAPEGASAATPTTVAAPAPARVSRPGAPVETSPAAPARAKGAGRPAERILPEAPASKQTLTRTDLTPDELEVLNEYVKRGEPEADMLEGIRVFRENQPKPAPPPAARAKPPVTADTPIRSAPKAMLKAAETAEYQRLIKMGNTPDQAMALIEQQRAFTKRMGLESSETVRRKVQDRNASGRWEKD